MEYDTIPNKKAKSDMWNNFWLKFDKTSKTVVESIAVCRHCDADVKYSGGTTNLSTHINRHHPNLKSTAKQQTLATSKAESLVLQRKQPTLHNVFQTKYKFNSDRASLITKAVADYIIDDLHPLSVVEGSGFKNMINILDPRYSLPGRTYFTQTLIPSLYFESVSKVKASLSGASMVALTTDGWTSRATESYVTITSIHITPEWKLKNFVLQTRAMQESHTGVHIAGVIREAIVEWGLPSNPPLVTDNAANMVVAAQELQSKPHIGCFAHTLNLAAQKSLKINAVSRILGRVRKLVAYFHRSTTAAALLKSKIKLLGLRDLKLIQDVPTRWNSAADMLERYLQLQPAIYAALVSKDMNTRDTEVTTLNETDTRLAQDIMDCLLPLRDMTNAICTEKTPTVSIILPLIHKLEKIMTPRDTDSSIAVQIKEAVSSNLSKRYSSEGIKEFLEECTVLDPRFKESFFESDKLYNICHRLTFQCCDVPVNVNIKTEQQSGSSAHVPQQPDLPLLPDVPRLPDVPTLPDQAALPNETKAFAHTDPVPVMTEDLPKKSTGLASIFDDVVIVKQEKGHRTPLQRANDELSRYSSEGIKEFLEECTVLDPRFKESFFESDKLYNICHRLTFQCCDVPVNVNIKTEQQSGSSAHVPQQPDLPLLPDVPRLPDVPTLPDQAALPNETKAFAHTDPVPVMTEDLPKKSTGLASIFDDVVIVKQEKGHRTPLQRANDELSRYREVPQISVNCDPLQWWKENSLYFPMLANIVKHRLCIPATSVPSERIFSTAGDIVTAQRAALSPGTVDQLIFLKKNREV